MTSKEQQIENVQFLIQSGWTKEQICSSKNEDYHGQVAEHSAVYNEAVKRFKSRQR